MSSQKSVSKLITDLQEWSDEKIAQGVDDILPVLVKSLKNQDEMVLCAKSIHVLFSTCLPHVPLPELEDKILQHTLPAVKQFFDDALEKIDVQLECSQSDDFIDVLVNLLQVCIDLLTSIHVLLTYMVSLAYVDISIFRNIPMVVISILLGSFKHCRDSQRLYGEHFQILNKDLTSLMRISHQVQITFFEVLTEKLHFNCQNEDDLQLLTEVMVLLERIGELVVGLDVRTMAQQWKGYAQLATQYAEHLRPVLDVIQPTLFLITDIQCSLENLVKCPDDATFVTRTIKVMVFELKLVIKLCENYGGYLGSCHLHMKLLILLYRYSKLNQQWSAAPVSNHIVQEVEVCQILAADVMLDHLVCDTDFIKRYFDWGENLSEKEDEMLIFLQLSFAILKKLCSSPFDSSIKEQWLGSEKSANILFVLFSSLEFCHAVLSWELEIPLEHSNNPKKKECEDEGPGSSMDLYEMLLTHVAGIFVSASEMELASIEEVLVENVLQPNPWRAMLAIDTWCILARCGGPELLFQHVRFLLTMLEQFPRGGPRPEQVYLRILVGRLLPRIFSSHMCQIVELYPPRAHSSVWTALGVTHLPHKLKWTISLELLSFASSAIEGLLMGPASVQLYNDVLNTLAYVPSCVEVGDKPDCVHALLKNLVLLWQHIPTTGVETNQWLQDLVTVLSKATASFANFLNNTQLIQVLQIAFLITSNRSLNLKIDILRILKNMPTKLIGFEQSKVFQYQTNMFVTLLQDGHPLVFQYALEVFEYFAKRTHHEQVITSIAKKMNSNNQSLIMYIQKLLPKKCNQENAMIVYKTYLSGQSLVKYTHKCIANGSKDKNEDQNMKLIDQAILSDDDDVQSVDSQLWDTNPEWTRRPKLDGPNDIVLNAIERLKEDSDIVVHLAEQNNLTAELRREVLNILNQCLNKLNQ